MRVRVATTQVATTEQPVERISAARLARLGAWGSLVVFTMSTHPIAAKIVKIVAAAISLRKNFVNGANQPMTGDSVLQMTNAPVRA